MSEQALKPPTPGFVLAFKDAFRAHKGLFWIAALYVLFVIAEASFLRVPTYEYASMLILALLQAAMSGGGIFAILLLFCLCLYFRCLQSVPWQGKTWAQYQAGVWEAFVSRLRGYWDSNALAQGIAGLVMLQSLGFLGMHKSMIPRLNPFHWDLFFEKWDKAFHFGNDPYWAIAAVVDRFHLERGIALTYYAWFFVGLGTIAYCLFCDRDLQRRMCFLWAYLLSWIIIGSFMSLLFSSAGPLFFHDFYPAAKNPFAGMARHLSAISDHVELRSFKMRDMLLRWAHNKNVVDLNGISAMPSMHVAVAWLQVLYGSMFGRVAFLLAAAFCAAILAGSVYLGYHYIIDGYVAILFSTLIWYGSRALVRRIH